MEITYVSIVLVMVPIPVLHAKAVVQFIFGESMNYALDAKEQEDKYVTCVKVREKGIMKSLVKSVGEVVKVDAIHIHLLTKERKLVLHVMEKAVIGANVAHAMELVKSQKLVYDSSNDYIYIVDEIQIQNTTIPDRCRGAYGGGVCWAAING